MALLKNLFAKKSEYVLEIEDTKGSEAPATAPQPEAEKSEPAKVEAALPEATAPAPSTKNAKASSPKADKKAKASSSKADKKAKASSPKADKKAKASSSKKADKKAKAAPTAPVAAPQPVKVAPAPAKAPAPVNTFATEHLMPRTGPRRRPGANMKSFLDMAAQMRK